MIKNLSSTSPISFHANHWMANLALPCLITTAMILVPTFKSNAAASEAQTISKIPTQQQLDRQEETQEMARVKMLQKMKQHEMIQIMSSDGPKAIVYHSQANGLSVSAAELAADAAKLAEYDVVRKACEKEAAIMDEMRWRVFDDMLAQLKVAGLPAVEQKIAEWETKTVSKRLIYLTLLGKFSLVESHVNDRLILVDPVEADASAITPAIWTGIEGRRSECLMARKFYDLHSAVLRKLVRLRDSLRLKEIGLQGPTVVNAAIYAEEQKIATRRVFLTDLMRKYQLTDLPLEGIDENDKNVVKPSLAMLGTDRNFMAHRSEYLCERMKYSSQIEFLKGLQALQP